MVSERPWVRVQVGPRFFPHLLHLVAQCGFMARATSIKKCMFCCSSVVLSRFRDEPKQGENVKGRLSGSVAQLAECSHGKREALGSSSGGAKIFSSPVTISSPFTQAQTVCCCMFVPILMFLRYVEHNHI